MSVDKLMNKRVARKVCIGCDCKLDAKKRIISADNWGYCITCFNNHVVDSLGEVQFLMKLNNIAKDDDLSETWENFVDKAEMLITNLQTYIKRRELK